MRKRRSAKRIAKTLRRHGLSAQDAQILAAAFAAVDAESRAMDQVRRQSRKPPVEAPWVPGTQTYLS